MPTVEEFTIALSNLKKKTAKELSFLQAHADAKARALTATKLSECAGYENYNAINLRYGLLAREIAHELKIDSGLIVLCDFFEPGEITNSEWVLIMRPEFANALVRAGWIVESHA